VPRRRRVPVGVALVLALVAGCSTPGQSATAPSSTAAPTSGSATPASATSGSATPASTPTTAGAAPTSSPSPAPSATPSAGLSTSPPEGSAKVVATVADHLVVPWGLATLPNGAVLVTSRDSFQISRLDVGAGRITLLGTVPGAVSDVAQQGETGLLGIAVSPRFRSDRLLFVFYSTASDNRIASLTYDPALPAGRQLGAPTVIVRGIPRNLHHDGGRLAFGPDGYLYATTGEAQHPALAQDRSSLGGKILRLTTTGRPAPGNPFGSLVWSYGHRNVQGIAWDGAGRLWASEFGDHSEDELNLIAPARNYGWPQTEGRTSRVGVTGPVAQWGPAEDSPSGVAVAGGAVWVAALRGERLWRVRLDGAAPAGEPQAFLVGRYGRLRSVLALDDHTLLVTTSNRDGRGPAGADDDRILLVSIT
jgi:glucose/arabinose dehydrogenase